MTIWNKNLADRDIVVGPGHSLNELTNRLLTVLRAENHGKDLWEFYPGIFGLYVRHSDDYYTHHGDTYKHFDNTKELKYYNEHIRYSTDNSMIIDYKSSGFYVNCIADVISNVICDVSGNFYSTYLDMKNQPTNRFHFLMMEFSDEAAEDVDYNTKISLERMCHRIRVKTLMEQEYMKTHNNLIWVNAGELLQKNYTSLQFFDYHVTVNHKLLFDPIIDQYNHLNQIAHPMIKSIVELSWDTIIAIADEYKYK